MKYLIVLVVALLVGCGGDDNRTSDTDQDKFYVLENGSNVNCGSGVGFGVDASANKLIDSGVAVISSTCGYALDSNQNISCDPFDTIYAHEIDRGDTDRAVNEGFYTIKNLTEIFGLEFIDTGVCL